MIAALAWPFVALVAVVLGFLWASRLSMSRATGTSLQALIDVQRESINTALRETTDYARDLNERLVMLENRMPRR